MATDKIQTGLRLEIVTLRNITYIAKRNKRSLNAQIEYLSRECMEKYEAQHGPIALEPDKWHALSLHRSPTTRKISG
ncbi:MAG: Arc family DNA-binding protein [Eubacteriales bacterium]|nr:Arc family DNA-binding protein [Eubacteriales bacterium]